MGGAENRGGENQKGYGDGRNNKLSFVAYIVKGCNSAFLIMKL